MGERNSEPDTTSFLWSYRLHEDGIFYQRLNFFLVAESMLFVAIVTLMSESRPRMRLIEIVIDLLGLVLTIVWWYVNRRQLVVVRQIQEEAKAVLPAYRKIREERPPCLISSTWLLAHFVPLVVGLSWLAMLLLGQLAQ